MEHVVELDLRIGGHLRLRTWRHEGAAALWPSAQHDAVELAWVESGAVGYRVGASSSVVRPGAVMVVPSGVEHATELLGPMRACSVWLGRGVLDEVAAAVGQRAALSFGPAPNGGRLAALGELLRRELAAPAEGHALLADSLLDALSVELLRAARTGAPRRARSPRIQRAVEHIESAFAEPLSVEALARTAGMSRFQFSRRFREEVGTSPYQYLLRTRVQAAAQLLRRGRASVTEAALSVGFGDLGRFARAFREHLGVFPSELRARRGDRARGVSATSSSF